MSSADRGVRRARPGLDELLTTRAALGARIALGDTVGTLTYAEWEAHSSRLAAALRSSGFEPGERIAVCRASDRWSAVWFGAIVRAGLVWAGINPRLTAVERDALLADVEPAAVVGHGSPGGADDPLQVPARLGRSNLASPSGLAAITFTSGSSGRPKGVMHSEAGALLGALAAAARGEAAGHAATGLSMSSLNMLVLGPLTSLVGGGACWSLHGLGAAALADAVQRLQIERMPLAAATVHDWLAAPRLLGQLSSLRDPVVGGSGCADDVLAAYQTATGHRLTLGYGLSEAPASVTREPRRMPRRPGTSGVALEHLDVIVDDGELVVRARQAGPWAGAFTGMLGYWRDAQATAVARSPLGLRTGDAGSVDADGFVTVHGRLRPTIVRGGTNVDPGEVAAAIATCPGVLDCQVIALPDERLGQVPAAVVVGDVRRAALIEWAVARLAPWKIPVRWAVVADDAALRDPASGKMTDASLRAAIARGETDSESDEPEGR